MKYLWISAFLFSHSVLANCPDENQQVALQGTLIQQTFPGPPNYESVKDGDEALTYDYLKLDQPFDCDLASENDAVPEVQIILQSKSQIDYPDLAPLLGKEVVLTGETMYAQTGRHFTPVLLILEKAQVVSPLTSSEQKKSALIQFQQFQQALREKNVAALKTYFVFPVDGILWDFIAYDESQSIKMEMLTEAEFDKNASQIIVGLQMLSELKVNTETVTINEYRINALTEQEQKRHYVESEEDGIFYYEENGQRHTVDGVCDTVADGKFEDNILQVSKGTIGNEQLPGVSEYCDGASVYTFKLLDGKLRLVSSFTAG